MLSAIGLPGQVHLPVSLLDERLDLAHIPFRYDAGMLDDGVAIGFHEQFCRSALGECPIAGVDVEALDDALRREVQVVPGNLELEVFRKLPHNTAAHLAVPFSTSAAYRFLDLPPVNLRNLQLHLSKNSLPS